VYSHLNSLISFLKCGPIAMAPNLKVKSGQQDDRFTVDVGGRGSEDGGGGFLSV
jgi:hypothetical protein